MDRYQFEGYISDYIENALSISKRKEFEQYLAENPEAKTQVDEFRRTIKNLNNLPNVKTSSQFIGKLKERIAQHSDVAIIEQKSRRPLIFGFTPLTATMMSLVVLAIVFVGYELLPIGVSSPVAIPTQVTTNNVLPNTSSGVPVNDNSLMAEADEDSIYQETETVKDQPDFDDKINYVRTQ